MDASVIMHRCRWHSNICRFCRHSVGLTDVTICPKSVGAGTVRVVKELLLLRQRIWAHLSMVCVPSGCFLLETRYKEP